MQKTQQKIPGKRFLMLTALFFASVFAAFYGASQAVKTPLSPINAQKVVDAWSIMSEGQPLSSWRSAPFELPVYLVCVKILGLSTYSAIAANFCFFMVCFGTGIFILHKWRLLSPINLLIWTAAVLPDTARMAAIQYAPLAISGMLFFSCFLAEAVKTRSVKDVTGTLCSGAFLALSFVSPLSGNESKNSFYETIRTLQKLFGADFSEKPLFEWKTVSYFFMSLFMLLSLFIMIRIILRTFRSHFDITELVYASAIFLTIFFLCLPFSNSVDEKTMLCAWIPYGAALLLMRVFRDVISGVTRIGSYRIPNAAAAAFVLLFLILCSLEPITFNRSAGPADQVVKLLKERCLSAGYCGISDAALFTVAGKGEITFHNDPEAPENEFMIFRTGSEPVIEASETVEYETYTVLILRSQLK